MTTLERKDTMDDAEITKLANEIRLDLQRFSTKAHAGSDFVFKLDEFEEDYIDEILSDISSPVSTSSFTYHHQISYNYNVNDMISPASTPPFPNTNKKFIKNANKNGLGLCIDVSSTICPMQRSRNSGKQKHSSPIPDFSNKKNPFSEKHRKVKRKYVSNRRVIQKNWSNCKVHNGKNNGKSSKNIKKKAKSVEDKNEYALQTEYGFLFVKSD